MPKDLDVNLIEQYRQKNENKNRREEEKQYIRETIAKNRGGKRKVTVILPQKKIYSYKDAPKIRVAAYCRVSTAEEAQVGSFEMQVQHFQALIENNPKYELVKIYADEGISGTSVDKRKGFIEMIETAKQGKIDLILTKSISRFGRNIVDVLTTLRLLSNLSPPVFVNFESEGINTSDKGNNLIITIMTAVAEMESQQKSIAIKAGIRYRMQEGLYKFSVSNMIGYYRDYTGRIKIDQAEAEIVKYIYDSFLEGLSPKEIADSLTDLGISTPQGMKCWRSGTIRNILKNEKYCGDVIYQKTYSKDYLSHKDVKNIDFLPKWHWENNHPAIIKRKKWNKVQKVFEGKIQINRKKSAKKLDKTFVVSRVKNGVLRGYYILDMNWTKDEREMFIEIADLI